MCGEAVLGSGTDTVVQGYERTADWWNGTLCSVAGTKRMCVGKWGEMRVEQ